MEHHSATQTSIRVVGVEVEHLDSDVGDIHVTAAGVDYQLFIGVDSSERAEDFSEVLEGGQAIGKSDGHTIEAHDVGAAIAKPDIQVLGAIGVQDAVQVAEELGNFAHTLSVCEDTSGFFHVEHDVLLSARYAWQQNGMKYIFLHS